MNRGKSFAAEADAARARIDQMRKGWLIWFLLGTAVGGGLFWP